MDSFAKEVEKYYSRFEEENRLKSAFGELEELRTQELLSHFLPGKEKRILDVGGATGVYSFYLAGQGHRVSLVDIVPKHIEQAKQLQSQEDGLRQLESMLVADGRELPFDNEVFDGVLVHGPLYHLVNRDDRVQVLKEAR